MTTTVATCLCAAPIRYRWLQTGYTAAPQFLSPAGQPVDRCGCGRLLTGRLLEVISYRNFR